MQLWIGSRRFGRRNFAGVEQFSSFGSSVGHRVAEGLVGLVAMVFAVVFALSGTLAIFGF